MLEGFRFIWKQKVILGAISLDLFAVLMGGVIALLPIYAEEILNLGPRASAGFAPRLASARSSPLGSWRHSDPRSCRENHVRMRRAVWPVHADLRHVDAGVAVDPCARPARRRRTW